MEDMERHVIAKMGKTWKTFKSELYNTYVKQDLVPNNIAYGYLAAMGRVCGEVPV